MKPRTRSEVSLSERQAGMHIVSLPMAEQALRTCGRILGSWGDRLSEMVTGQVKESTTSPRNAVWRSVDLPFAIAPCNYLFW